MEPGLLCDELQNPGQASCEREHRGTFLRLNLALLVSDWLRGVVVRFFKNLSMGPCGSGRCDVLCVVLHPLGQTILPLPL
jgi:hypothetical protein